MYNKDFAGKNGFTWFIGVIEDRQDPLKMGRVRVRCVGWHADNRMQMPVDGLPWAQLMLPANYANEYAPKEGSMVFGTKDDMFLVGYNNYERKGKNLTKKGHSIEGVL